MRATKGNAKHFIVLEVQREGKSSWGELQYFEYIEGDKFATRKAALKDAERARMRWQDNYAQFNGARFRMYDSAANAPEPKSKARKPHDLSAAPLTRKQYAQLQEAGVSAMVLDRATFDPAALHDFIAAHVGE